mgnify:CR=1 FL=1
MSSKDVRNRMGRGFGSPNQKKKARRRSEVLERGREAGDATGGWGRTVVFFGLGQEEEGQA